MSIYVLLIIFFLYLVYLSMQSKQITIMIGKDLNTVLNCINNRKISSSRKLDSFSCHISDRSSQYSKKC